MVLYQLACQCSSYSSPGDCHSTNLGSLLGISRGNPVMELGYYQELQRRRITKVHSLFSRRPSVRMAWLAIADHICTGISYYRNARFLLQCFLPFINKPISHIAYLPLRQNRVLNQLKDNNIWCTHPHLYRCSTSYPRVRPRITRSKRPPLPSILANSRRRSPLPHYGHVNDKIQRCSYVLPDDDAVASVVAISITLGFANSVVCIKPAVNLNTLNGPEMDEKQKQVSTCTSNDDCAASG